MKPTKNPTNFSRGSVKKEDKTDLEIIEEFSHFCILCGKRIAVFCGTPVVQFAGCCVGVDHPRKKKRYLRILKCHMDCYLDLYLNREKLQDKKLKLMWDFDDVKKIVKGNGD